MNYMAKSIESPDACSQNVTSDPFTVTQTYSMLPKLLAFLLSFVIAETWPGLPSVKIILCSLVATKPDSIKVKYESNT